jgi:alpha-1,2-mannosyltransferase
MNRTFKITILLWLLYAIIMIFFVGHHRTVSINYWLAANQWIAERPLYSNNGIGYIYLPQSAILYALLTPLSFDRSEELWRILSLSVFIWGLLRISELISALTAHKLKTSFLVLSLIAFPLCFDSVRNGQAHLMVTGLMMLATYSISKERWQQAAFLTALALFIKPTAIVYLLLVSTVFFSDIGLYLLLWIAGFMFLPFLTASGTYVISQYIDFSHMLVNAANLGHSQDWAQIFNLISQSGWEMPHFFQNLTRLLVALLVLVTAYLIKNKARLANTSLWILMLAMVYLMLFNPRTENNDYMMLTPVLGYCIIECIQNKKIFGLLFLLLLTFSLIDCFYISNLIPGHRNWAAPFMTVILAAWLALDSGHLMAKAVRK